MYIFQSYLHMGLHIITRPMKKETLILLHGGPGLDPSYFFPSIDPLKEKFKICAYTIGSTIPEPSLSNLQIEFSTLLQGLKDERFSIIAHSFGSFLALSEATLKKYDNINKIFLVNWIYNDEWIEDFYKNNPEERNNNFESLKESFKHYSKYYFRDLSLAEPVFDKIKYSDRIFNQIASEFSEISLFKYANMLSSKIVSISSEYDGITSKQYHNKINNMLNLKSYHFNNSGHFPFIEQPDFFLKIINEETKAHR